MGHTTLILIYIDVSSRRINKIILTRTYMLLSVSIQYDFILSLNIFEEIKHFLEILLVVFLDSTAQLNDAATIIPCYLPRINNTAANETKRDRGCNN